MQGNWPLLKILNLNAKVAKKGLLHFTLNTKFHELKQLTPSLFMRPEAHFSEKLLRANWHLLTELDLNSSQITENEIEAIVSKSEWPNLKILDLSFNEITDEGFVVLSQGNWPQLAMLTPSVRKTVLPIAPNLAEIKTSCRKLRKYFALLRKTGF